LTLLSAPGGFGKTAVLAEWLVAAPADEPVASARTGGPRRVCHSTTTMSRDLAFRSSCANTGEWSRLFPEPEVPMSRVQKEPLRRLRPEERSHLERVSRAFSLPAALVARAKVLLAVATNLVIVSQLPAALVGSWSHARHALVRRDPGSTAVPC
jgi:hypothetical protein